MGKAFQSGKTGVRRPPRSLDHCAAADVRNLCFSVTRQSCCGLSASWSSRHRDDEPMTTAKKPPKCRWPVWMRRCNFEGTRSTAARAAAAARRVRRRQKGRGDGGRFSTAEFRRRPPRRTTPCQRLRRRRRRSSSTSCRICLDCRRHDRLRRATTATRLRTTSSVSSPAAAQLGAGQAVVRHPRTNSNSVLPHRRRRQSASLTARLRTTAVTRRLPVPRTSLSGFSYRQGSKCPNVRSAASLTPGTVAFENRTYDYCIMPTVLPLILLLLQSLFHDHLCRLSLSTVSVVS